MTTTTPEPDSAAAERQASLARLSEDPAFQTVYAPPFYPDRMEGPGRWATLTVAGEPIGILWTNDRDGLGFIAQGTEGIVRNSGFATAFSAARAQGTPASDVFTYYAEKAGMGLGASETTIGNLDTLNT